MLNTMILTGFLAGLAGLAGPTSQGDRPNATAAASGQQSFRTYCGSCHGAEGKGDGPLASALKTPPADLTMISQRNGGQFPFDDVKKKIDGREKVTGHGSSDMPVWGDAFKTTDTEDQAQKRIDDITNFLWSIQVVSGE